MQTNTIMKKSTLLMLALSCMAALFFSSCNKNQPDEPKDGEARYSILVYGHAGGHMDRLMEGVWERLKPQMTNKDVRISFLYKYGKASPDAEWDARYAQPGALLDFELTNTTNLDSLRYTSTTTGWEDFELYDPELLKIAINDMKKTMPAQNYILLIWGHGAAYDPVSDYPKELRDGRNKAPQGVLYDEWLPLDTTGNNVQAMSMYELSEAIASSDIPHLKAIFFHNCLLGNMETLDQIYEKADYLFSSMHLLVSTGTPVEALVKSLYASKDFEKAGIAALSMMEPQWSSFYKEEGNLNGDFNFIKSSEFPVLDPVFARLSKRLIELYPTRKEAIDRALDNTYKPVDQMHFYDALDYANKLAKETNDAELKTIAADLKNAFDKIWIKRLTVNNRTSETRNPAEFALSVYMTNKTEYEAKVGSYQYTLQQAYEYSRFGKQSQWGNWIHTNTHTPQGNPYGAEM